MCCAKCVNTGIGDKIHLNMWNGNEITTVQSTILEVPVQWKLLVFKISSNVRSRRKRLRYTSYLGDGDSKLFNDVVAADVYPGYVVEKDEGIGHVQKRVGARLWTYQL